MSLQDKITDELRDDLYGENSNPIKKSIAEFQELNDSLSTPS